MRTADEKRSIPANYSLADKVLANDVPLGNSRNLAFAMGCDPKSAKLGQGSDNFELERFARFLGAGAKRQLKMHNSVKHTINR
jgi:hypothetical protein